MRFICWDIRYVGFGSIRKSAWKQIVLSAKGESDTATKIEAIKAYRELKNVDKKGKPIPSDDPRWVGLKEAKFVVEGFFAQNRKMLQKNEKAMK